MSDCVRGIRSHNGAKALYTGLDVALAIAVAIDVAFAVADASVVVGAAGVACTVVAVGAVLCTASVVTVTASMPFCKVPTQAAHYTR